ncbi:HEPN domain-containing protein [Candidatus Kaiserbacteria bacterium]|nr:HEPN domain-containing protein [Candidatus Kaiserbacteria bacterium]
MFDTEHIQQFWREKSGEDFAVAQMLLASNRNTYALFFCHLAIEKLLKALVVRKTNANAAYDHNLQRLASDAGLQLSDTMQESLAEINTFNIKGRYDEFKSQFYKKATTEYTENYLRETEHILVWLKTQ